MNASKEKQKFISEFLEQLTNWSMRREDIIATALVGSWARGQAREDSDVDLMFLVNGPEMFRESTDWLEEFDWSALKTRVVDWHDGDYGVVWSRHVHLFNAPKVEFSFGSLSWASINPLDAGTARVMGDGHKILYDSQGLLQNVYDELKRLSQ